MAANGGRAHLRENWWLLALAVVAAGLFTAGFVVRLECGRLGFRCGGSPLVRLLDLDELGGLPRLFTTGVFVAVAVLAWRARSRSVGGAAAWWAMVAVAGVGLAVAKLVSAHSIAKTDTSAGLTLVVGLGLTVTALVVLGLTGRRWRVPGWAVVVAALAVYAAASLGLDVVTGLVELARGGGGRLTAAAATFVEEFGEALTALLLLGAVFWQTPEAPVTAGAGSRRGTTGSRGSGATHEG